MLTNQCDTIERDIIECDINECDIIERDIVECDIIERDIIECDIIERDIIERDITECDIIEGQICGFGIAAESSVGVPDVRSSILDLLRPLGITERYFGVRQLIQAVEMVIENPDTIHALQKEVYDVIALQYSVSWGAVERNLRSISQKAWDTDSGYVEKLAGHPIADHSAYLLGAMNGNMLRYDGLKGCTDYKKAAQLIKDGGYATNSTYVEKLCNIIEKYNLTQYDTAAAQPDTGNDSVSGFPATPFKVRVLIDDLNYRSLPSMDGAVRGQTGKGVFTITKVTDGWGKLKSGAGWIYLGNPSYCTVQGATSAAPEQSTTPEQPTASNLPYKVRVSVSDLNIRKGPGTNYGKTGRFTGKGVFTIVEEADGPGASKWGLLKAYAGKRNGWIALDHTSKV